jgi:predicted SAM-dependent methyltransferase
MKKLNLGCGRDYKIGWLNWDVSRETKADAYLDIGKDRYPAKDNEIDEIYCSGVLEQLLSNEELIHALNECHRVLKDAGALTIIVPSAKFANAFKDPMDVRQFTEPTFKYFDGESHEYKAFGSVYGFKPWYLTTIFTNEQGIITAVMQKVGQ